MICTLVEQLVQQWASSVASPAEITLVIENIPGDWGKTEAMHWINQSGFVGTYDFLLLSRSCSPPKGAGTAIVNFVDEEAAERFEEALNGVLAGPRHVVAMSISPTQGLAENVLMLVRSQFGSGHDLEDSLCDQWLRGGTVLPLVSELSTSSAVYKEESSQPDWFSEASTSSRPQEEAMQTEWAIEEAMLTEWSSEQEMLASAWHSGGAGTGQDSSWDSLYLPSDWEPAAEPDVEPSPRATNSEWSF